LGDAGAALLTGGSAVLGALVGSFLCVVIRRVPAGLSIVKPGSACPDCAHPIRPVDNIPIVSWLALGGRCRDCRRPISPRYPIIEAATAVVFGLVAWWMLSASSPIGDAVSSAGAAAPVVQVLLVASYLWFAAAGIALAVIDLDTHRLPNAIVLPGYAVAAIGLVVPAAVSGDVSRLVTTVAGAAILFGVYLLLSLAWQGGMGAGDVKLAGVIGAFLGFSGWGPLAVGAFAAFVLGGLASLVLLALRRAARRTAIPFGPWMLAGAWVGIVAGAPIADAYLSLFGITQV
jgi:leader peptidase (prepilin peptidase) / N-methyltransferase